LPPSQQFGRERKKSDELLRDTNPNTRTSATATACAQTKEKKKEEGKKKRDGVTKAV